MLQEEFDVDGKIIESVELVGGDVYLSPLDSTGWNGNPPKAEYPQEVTVALCTVLHTQLDMTVAQDESAFPNKFFIRME